LSFQRSTSCLVMACPYLTLSWAKTSLSPTLGWPMACPPPTLSWVRARPRPTLIWVVTGPRPTLSRVVTHPHPISSWTRMCPRPTPCWAMVHPRPTPCWVKDASAPNSIFFFFNFYSWPFLGAVTSWPNSSLVQRVSWTQLLPSSVYRKKKKHEYIEKGSKPLYSEI
jgi:hypothetical protein